MRGSLSFVRGGLALLLGLPLLVALAGCLLETEKPVFGPADAVAPAGLAESYRLDPPARGDGEAEKSLYLRLRPEAAGAYEATLFGIEGTGEAALWKAETYIMRFIALDGGWYIWELAEPPEAKNDGRWYGLVQFGDGICQWVDSIDDAGMATLEHIAGNDGLSLKKNLGPTRVEGALSPDALKRLLRSLVDGQALTTPMGRCEPSSLPAELTAATGSG